MANNWFLYILRCGDGSLYTGITVNIADRLEKHRSGKGAKYTKGRGPLELVYQEKCGSHSDALKREYAMKQITKSEKEKLISMYQLHNSNNSERLEERD